MPEILRPKEVAHYLKMSVLTVYKHAKEGVIPGFRVGNSWRFDKTKIDDLLIGSYVNEGLAGQRSATMR
jgi:excisionase family DNA binding protein